MSVFEPTKHHLQEVLLYFFSVKKSVIEPHRLLVEAYSEATLSETTYRDWFRRFKSGNFDMEEKNVLESQNWLKMQNWRCYSMKIQTQDKLVESLGIAQSTISMRLKILGMIQKQGNWVPYELKPRDLERHFHV